MDLYTKKGEKVKYLGVNGYDSDKEYANKYLKVGDVYTVKYVDIGNRSSQVYLEGFPVNQFGFNTVMFENVTNPTDHTS